MCVVLCEAEMRNCGFLLNTSALAPHRRQGRRSGRRRHQEEEEKKWRFVRSFFVLSTVLVELKIDGGLAKFGDGRVY